MKVFVVNGYGKSEAKQREFQRFLKIIKKSFETITAAGMEPAAVTIIDHSNVKNYIYISDTELSRTDTMKRFDSADFVFFDGDANLLPWSNSCKDFGLLFKQCKQTNKCVFAAGFAFYMLIYYCATNYAQFNVVNGRGWGTKLDSITSFPTHNLRAGAAFLDNETGDIYGFNPESQYWIPITNSGLHYARNVSNASIGQFVKNVKIYRGKPRIMDINDVYKSKQNESVCFIRKAYVQHWAFIGVPRKFLVSTKNAWDSHPVNVMHIGLVGPNYSVLADSEKGATIIQHRNTLSTLFHIDIKHSEGPIILYNFIQYNSMLIQKEGRVDIPLELALAKERAANTDPDWMDTQSKKLEDLAKKHKIAFKALEFDSKNTTNFTTTFKRCGWSYSKRLNILVVRNNAIREKTQKAKEDKHIKNLSVFSSPRAMQMDIKERSVFTPNPESYSSQMRSQDSLSQTQSKTAERTLQSGNGYEKFTTKDSQMKASMSCGSFSSKEITSGNGSIRIRTHKFSPYCRYKYFQRLPQYNPEIPCIRTGSVYETPEERERRERREGKKQWLSPKNFKTVTSRGEKPNFIDNYVFRDISEPPANHKFREFDRKKWIAGQFIFLNKNILILIFVQIQNGTTRTT